ncbi:MAG TPA: MFS transporter [Mycobacteriales bacterium]|nr:MFS transporter [Mycobacteriales bacterium]
MEFIRDLWGLLRARSTRGGALESGLSATCDLNVINAGVDTMVAIALASQLFFAAPTSQARGQVALYLLTTMAPFALLAPVVGPILDRVGRRRVALGATLVARAILAWLLAGHSGGIALYPIALASLVFSRGFGVAKSAIVPRIVPPATSLVIVNSRLQFASTLGSVLAAPIGAGISSLLGYRVLLRVAALGYLLTVLLVARLPAHVDSPAGAGEHRAAGLPAALLGGHPRAGRLLGNLPAALRGVLPMRALVGFLTLFLAFYLRESGRGTLALGLLAGASALGNVAGLLLGRAAGHYRPEKLITVSALLALGSSIAAAVFFSYYAALALAGVATLASVTAKLSLDAVIQRDVAEDVRASAFGRSETAVQLAWVIGGAVGLIPFAGRLGFVLASVAMSLAVLTTVFGVRTPVPRRRRPHLRRAAGQAPSPPAG